MSFYLIHDCVPSSNQAGEEAVSRQEEATVPCYVLSQFKLKAFQRFQCLSFQVGSSRRFTNLAEPSIPSLVLRQFEQPSIENPPQLTVLFSVSSQFKLSMFQKTQRLAKCTILSGIPFKFKLKTFRMWHSKSNSKSI